MPDELQAMLRRRAVDRQVRIAILHGPDFQEVQLRRRETLHDPRRFFRRPDRNAQPLERFDARLGRILPHPL